MTPVCPFAQALRPDDTSSKKSGDPSKHQLDTGDDDQSTKESGDSPSAPPKCPFATLFRSDDGSVNKTDKNSNQVQSESEDKAFHGSGDPVSLPSKCPFSKEIPSNGNSAERTDISVGEPEDNNLIPNQEHDNTNVASGDSATISPKCPFGFDSKTFKIGPLSCILCQALLFNCSKCVPCSHLFCKACISRFSDCPLCGADIEGIEDETNIQGAVDRFLEGHARIKRSHVEIDVQSVANNNSKVIYEDVSLERGAFMVQQALHMLVTFMDEIEDLHMLVTQPSRLLPLAFRGQNFESAKSRLSLCADDIREQIDRTGHTPGLCSQLGAVLGMLGDCCRAMVDSASAIMYFEESVEFLSKLPSEDQEIQHTLSVSLNKIGDLKYYDGDLQAARSYYLQSLNVRRGSVKLHPDSPSQVLDVATSLAKVADVDRNLGSEDVAIDRFQEAIKMLESLNLKSEDATLKQRRSSVLVFLKNQIAQPDVAK